MPRRTTQRTVLAEQLRVKWSMWALENYNSVLTMLVVADVDGADDYDMVRHYENKNKRK
jgi:hypothetical protein